MLLIDAGAVNFEGISGDDLLDAWIFCSGDELVSEVWSAGRLKVEKGLHCTRSYIARRFRQTLLDLRSAF